MILLPSQALVLNAYAVLVYQTPGNPTLKQHEAYIAANGEAGYKTALNNAFANSTTSQLATTLLTNLGLNSVFTQTDAEAYLNANASNRVGAMIDLASALYNYVGDDAGLLSAKSNYVNNIDGSYNYSINTGNTATTALTPGFTLTTGIDTASSNLFHADQAYTPGGDDFVNTLQDVDTLTGTATDGTNTLNATLGNANDNGAAIITPMLNNMDIINAAFVGSGITAVTALDLQDTTGLDTVNITRITQSVNNAEMGNIQSVLGNMSVAHSNANQAGTVEFSFGQDVLLGANEGALALTNVQVNNLNIGMNNSGIALNGVALQGYETLNLTSAGTTNSINTLNLPMDTNTVGALNIDGATNLRIGGQGIIYNAANNALTEAVSWHTAGTGIAQAGGRIAAVNAADFTGNLTLVLDNILDIGKADTSGVVQPVTVTGGTGNDTFALYDVIQATDSINGGEGTDNLVMYSGTAINSVAGSIENVTMLGNGMAGGVAVADAIAADFDFLPDVTGATLRNISHTTNVVAGIEVNAAGGVNTFTLTDLSATQATGISIQHATTGNNQITNNIISTTAKTSTTSNTIGVTIDEGLNTDPRFNFTMQDAVAANTWENVTLTDSDTESNTVRLVNFVDHTGTITLNDGLAGTFLNLDATANTQRRDQTGLAADGVGFTEPGAGAAERLAMQTFAAADFAGNITARFSTEAADITGGQSITTGTGNDMVIFDLLNDSRAGLTISDTVAGGLGSDTLAIDGEGARISLGASEWTNVSGFETIRLMGNGQADNNAPGQLNAYNLVLTNDMIATNGTNGTNIAIINDNDPANDAANVPDTAGTGVERGLTLDARTLRADMHFSYKGEEGLTRTADRLILADANINGGNVIDGGAVSNASFGAPTVTVGWGLLGNAGNADVMEVRNSGVAAVGDLANIKNIGTVEFTNDQIVAQNSTIQLNDTIVDSMVNSFQASTSRATPVTGGNVERLAVSSVDNIATTLFGAAQGQSTLLGSTGLIVEASVLTDKSDLDILLGRGANTVVTGSGQDRAVLLGSFRSGTYVAAADAFNGRAINDLSDFNATAAAPVARVVTDNINMGNGLDELITYGSINLAGATLAGIERLTANSDVTMTDAQLNDIIGAGGTFVFNSTGAHTLTITHVVGETAVDMSKISFTQVVNIPGGATTGAITLGTGVTSTGTVVTPAGSGAVPVTSDTPVVDPCLDGQGTVGGTPAVIDASSGSYSFTDAVTVDNNVMIYNYGTEDTITVSGATSTDYDAVGVISNNTTTGDVTINFVNTAGGATNTIVLPAIAVGTTVNSVATFNALAVGDLSFGSTPTPVVTINVTGAGTSDVSAGNTKAVFAAGNYTYTLNTFIPTDIIDLPDTFFNNASIINTSTTDGLMTVSSNDGSGNVITVELTGVPLEQDAAVYGVNSFNTAFGAGSLI